MTILCESWEVVGVDNVGLQQRSGHYEMGGGSETSDLRRYECLVKRGEHVVLNVKRSVGRVISVVVVRRMRFNVSSL
jgi:hypothetical protein